MAQPSVAREPSMEEILASIRRIIESNEPQAETSLQHSLPPVYAEDEIDEDDMGIVAEMAANDRGLPQREAFRPVEPSRLVEARQPEAYQPYAEPQPERSLSLADVAARVRAAADRPAEPRFEPRVEPGMEARPEPVAASAPVAAAPARSPVARQPEPEAAYREPQRPVPSPAPQQAQLNEAPPAPAPRAPEPRAPEVMQAEAPLPAERPDQQALPAKTEAMLMSQEAGAQVARSFGELAAAFDGVQNRSLEDLAQEMLRPMLQEWLDDNLPTLVERLVREEIERVARGPRR
ncbi:cell pole-organizing protein PopZ [Pseudorhizobium tarimense]|uniref:Cell pole-organizing protein PopZ n=1 Tax=Pseudorhizobium tarimense TaxID=1079109 RepID=A0ABV2HAC5_9HYPH|nr:DUF2497 domain-containing protein [Pseudorhizobium tarimense]MCJ8520499.1 DUF2497 domain-containing protein [Pseudorhizobium tarimense]